MKKFMLLASMMLFSLATIFAQLNIDVTVLVVTPNGGLLDSVPVSLTADICAGANHQSSGITIPGIGYQDNFVANCTQGMITAIVSCPGGSQTETSFYSPADTIITITMTCGNSNPVCDATFTYDSIAFYPSVLTNSYYYWDFGNGTTSNQVSPQNNLAPGTYNVCLFTETPADSCFSCQNIVIGAPPSSYNWL